jgi:hypothetical protein
MYRSSLVGYKLPTRVGLGTLLIYGYTKRLLRWPLSARSLTPVQPLKSVFPKGAIYIDTVNVRFLVLNLSILICTLEALK